MAKRFAMDAQPNKISMGGSVEGSGGHGGNPGTEEEHPGLDRTNCGTLGASHDGGRGTWLVGSPSVGGGGLGTKDASPSKKGRCVEGLSVGGGGRGAGAVEAPSEAGGTRR
mmetsp:Transcript_47234/g.125456  ORF Transcript_47234/g.125456 Transcript_47234/m.125456 type:complete len:111 (+) Transcript_47234:332-664(+)